MITGKGLNFRYKIDKRATIKVKIEEEHPKSLVKYKATWKRKLFVKLVLSNILSLEKTLGVIRANYNNFGSNKSKL